MKLKYRLCMQKTPHFGWGTNPCIKLQSRNGFYFELNSVSALFLRCEVILGLHAYSHNVVNHPSKGGIKQPFQSKASWNFNMKHTYSVYFDGMYGLVKLNKKEGKLMGIQALEIVSL